VIGGIDNSSSNRLCRSGCLYWLLIITKLFLDDREGLLYG
jgi:hypothetical protein